jgi:hypothetical protein
VSRGAATLKRMVCFFGIGLGLGLEVVFTRWAETSSAEHPLGSLANVNYPVGY